MDLSLVVPVFNEEENIVPLLDEIYSVLNGLPKKSEVIIVNDGSGDKTAEKLNQSTEQYPTLKVIHLRKNFGQTSAMVAGFDNAQGDIVISMDGDGQNDPKDIPLILSKIDEGFDIVSGWRKNRQDRFINRRLPSMIANWIISKATKVKLHDYGCSLKAFRREVIQNTNLYGEMHRFIPAVASWMGVNLTEIEVNHRARTRGQSKYGISRTFRVILDLITVKFLLSFITKPIQVFGLWGLFSFLSGSALFSWVLYERFFCQVPANRPLLTISLLLIVSAFQFISFGLLAEMQVRAYHESTEKPIYAIKSIKTSKDD